MVNALLDAQGLTKRFPQGTGEIEILHGIDLALYPGEIVAILGPSGAGKSTLLHLLGLMEAPSGGRIEIAGQDIKELTIEKRARMRNVTIGFLFQFHHLLQELTVMENVTLPQRIRGLSSDVGSTKAKELLVKIGMIQHADSRPATLSGGEQQRAALARALINEPSIILADEPTGNLDKESGEAVLNLLWSESKQRNAATVIVTHQEEIATRADRWIRLRDGRIETQGKRTL